MTESADNVFPSDPLGASDLFPGEGDEPRAPTTPPESAPPVALRRFCSVCGSARDPVADYCPACTSRADTFRLNASGAKAIDVSRAGHAGIKSALSLYFTLLVISVIAVSVSLANHWTADFDIGLSIASAIIVAIWSLTAWRDVGPALAKTGPLRWYVAVVPAAIVTFTIATGAVRLMHRLFGVEILSYSESFIEAGYGWNVIIVLIAVTPAVFEELAFRGVILPGMAKVLTPSEAVMVSALMFMVLHLSVASFPHLLLIGVTLGFLRVRTGSLYPGILLHFTHNLLCVLAERYGI